LTFKLYNVQPCITVDVKLCSLDWNAKHKKVKYVNSDWLCINPVIACSVSIRRLYTGYNIVTTGIIRSSDYAFLVIRSSDYVFLVIRSSDYVFLVIRSSDYVFLVIRSSDYVFLVIRSSDYVFLVIRSSDYVFLVIRSSDYVFLVIRVFYVIYFNTCWSCEYGRSIYTSYCFTNKYQVIISYHEWWLEKTRNVSNTAHKPLW